MVVLMKKIAALGSLLLISAMLSLACSDDSGDGSTDGAGGGGFCQVGMLGCGCSGSFPCSESGVECVNGQCIMCTAGDMGCACDSTGMCSTGTCTDPDPTCMLNCEQSTCQ